MSEGCTCAVALGAYGNGVGGPVCPFCVRKMAAAAFLADLTALSRKYSIMVDGCGCCGSPRPVPIDADRLEPGYGYQLDDHGCLVWKAGDHG